MYLGDLGLWSLVVLLRELRFETVEFGVWGLQLAGIRFAIQVQSLGHKVWGSGFRVQGCSSGFGVRVRTRARGAL